MKFLLSRFQHQPSVHLISQEDIIVSLFERLSYTFDRQGQSIVDFRMRNGDFKKSVFYPILDFGMRPGEIELWFHRARDCGI